MHIKLTQFFSISHIYFFPAKVCNIDLFLLFMFVDLFFCFLFASLIYCSLVCQIIDMCCLASEIEGKVAGGLCFELLDKLVLNADGVRFVCCVNSGIHPVMLLFVKIFPNLFLLAFLKLSYLFDC